MFLLLILTLLILTNKIKGSCLSLPLFTREIEYGRSFYEDAQAAYCKETSIENFYKPYLNCSNLDFFEYYNVSNAEAFIIRSGGTMIVSIAGTDPNDIQDIIADITNISPVNMGITITHEAVLVGSAFYNHADRLYGNISNAIQNHQSFLTRLIFTGHSLGGAMAQIISIKLHSSGIIERGFEVVTFNSPCAGNMYVGEYLEMATKSTVSGQSQVRMYIDGGDIISLIPRWHFLLGCPLPLTTTKCLWAPIKNIINTGSFGGNFIESHSCIYGEKYDCPVGTKRQCSWKL